MATDHCLPVINGYPVLPKNPYCQNGWGWLNEGECGCFGGSTLVEPASPGWDPVRRGCSVQCGGVGPNECPKCDNSNTTMYLLGGAAALAVLFLFRGRK